MSLKARQCPKNEPDAANIPQSSMTEPPSYFAQLFLNGMAMVTGLTRDEPDATYAHDSPETTATYSPIANLDNSAGGIKQEESDAIVRPMTSTSTSTFAHRTFTCSWCFHDLAHASSDESVKDEATSDGSNGAPSIIL
ncbi:hypothetical protein BKA80DRAFT_312512 [Phyllosticta citrichinensis]